VEAKDVLEGVKGTETVYFTERDVVRHELVQKIIRAYSKYEEDGRAGRRERTGLPERR
jgi:phosphate starvation-inducible PhoH-like protein